MYVFRALTSKTVTLGAFEICCFPSLDVVFRLFFLDRKDIINLLSVCLKVIFIIFRTTKQKHQHYSDKLFLGNENLGDIFPCFLQ